MSARLQIHTQFSVVVNLAIEHDADRPILIPHGLRTASDVENRQSTMAQMDTGIRIDKRPVSVGAPVTQDVGHRYEVIAITCPDESGKAAHQDFGPNLISSRMRYEKRPCDSK